MARSASTDDYATVVAAIVQARKAAGVSQVELAARISKPQSFISKIERRERRVDVLEFCAIARALGLQPASLLGEIDARLVDDIAL
jgi:transcriptional regulator with XRE-family HTH domain